LVRKNAECNFTAVNSFDETEKGDDSQRKRKLELPDSPQIDVHCPPAKKVLTSKEQKMWKRFQEKYKELETEKKT
jgi:hypothetical protein